MKCEWPAARVGQTFGLLMKGLGDADRAKGVISERLRRTEDGDYRVARVIDDVAACCRDNGVAHGEEFPQHRLDQLGVVRFADSRVAHNVREQAGRESSFAELAGRCGTVASSGTIGKRSLRTRKAGPGVRWRAAFMAEAGPRRERRMALRATRREGHRS